MNTQEAFHAMVQHLREQGMRSETGSSVCVYRHPDGLRCAIGAIIPDELYAEDFEGRTVDALLRETPALQALLQNVDRKVLADMQDIHDFTDPRYWEESFEELAREARLTLPAWAGQQRQADTRKT